MRIKINTKHKINRNDISEKLWAGIFDKVNFDLLKHSAEINITVTETAIRKSYCVKFNEITKFKFEQNDPEIERNYIELTEIEIFQSG